MRKIIFPFNPKTQMPIEIGERIEMCGSIITGRDAVLPKLVELVRQNRLYEYDISLDGAAIFHTAVSGAGIGPTSSNKYEIESSIIELSQAGVKMHIGKGKIKEETIIGMSQYNSVFAVTPPLSALLSSSVLSHRVLAFPELGMEALYLLEVKDFPVIVVAAAGNSLDAGKC